MNNKKLERTKVLHAFIAAQAYEYALMFSNSAKSPTSLEDVQETADFINLCCKKSISAFDCMKSVENNTNISIDYYNIHRKTMQNYQFDKLALENFCKYYANTGNEIAFWKCNSEYIILIGLAILDHFLGNLTKSQLDEKIQDAISPEEWFFTFNKYLVLKSFVEATNKLTEIEKKIESRKLSTNSFTGIPCN